MGYRGGVPFTFWHGSHLCARTAKSLIEKNTATTLQVNSAILAAVAWMLRNPDRGLIEPEDLDDEFVLKITDPYTAPMIHTYSSWNPLLSLSSLIPRSCDSHSVFQFSNFRVA